MRSTRLQRLTGLTTIAGLAFWGGWTFLASPFWSIFELRSDTTALRARVPELAAKAATGPAVRAGLEKLSRQRVNVIGQELSPGAAEAAIRRTVGARGAEVSSLRWQMEADRPALALEVTLRVTDLEGLVFDLEYGLPPMVIETLSAERYGAETGEIVIVNIASHLPTVMLGGQPP